MLVRARQHLDHIRLQTCIRLNKKYRAGQKEHGGFLPDLGVSKLLDEAIKEAIDQVVYLLTIRDLLDGR